MRPSLIDRLTIVALIAVPLAFGLFALFLGQDANWDLRNYHWYNPYAFLNDRLMKDLAVAHQPTYFNPVLDLPVYLLGRELPARAIGFLLGTVHGLNFVLVFMLANMLLAEAGAAIPEAGRRGIAALVALVGVLGGGHLAVIGTTFNDNLVSLPIFAAAVIVVRHRDVLFAHSALGRKQILVLLGSGALMGLATALKMTNGVYPVGFCLAFLFAGGAFKQRFAQSFVFGLGVLTGFAIIGLPWMIVLWRELGNPFFPYFNAIFRSPMALPEGFPDWRFRPRSAMEALTYPFIFTFNPQRVGEIVFRDARIAVAYGTLWLTAALFISQRMRPRLAPAARYVIAAAALSYVPWLAMFSIYRYIIPLEMLAPLLAVLAFAAWPMSVRWQRAAIIGVLALVTVTTQRGIWERRGWHDGPFVTVAPPAVPDPASTLALVTGTEPVGWVVPYFPPEIPFIRIQGYIVDHRHPTALTERARALIAGHRGAIFALFPHWQATESVEALAAYSLALDRESCQPVRSNLGDDVHWCRVTRIEPVSP